jgi:hypothetical protein
MRCVLAILVVFSVSCRVVVAQGQFGKSARTVNTMIEVPDATWMLSEGVILRMSRSTEELQSSSQLKFRNKVIQTTRVKIDSATFPTMFCYTSKNSPLLSGSITRLLIDEQRRLWAFDDDGDASMFDGEKWETIRHTQQGTPTFRYDFDEGMFDVVIQNGVLRVATGKYVDEINLRSLKRTTLLESEYFLEGPLFVSYDILADDRFHTIVYLDTSAHRAYKLQLQEPHDVSDQAQTIPFGVPSASVPTNREQQPTAIDRDLHDAIETSIQRYQDSLEVGAIQVFLRTLGACCCNSGRCCIEWATFDPYPFGKYFDMVSDVNGTVYIASREGIIVIPSTVDGKAERLASPLAALQIHPNPAANHVLLDLPAVPTEDVTARLIDASGSTVRTATIRALSTTLDVSTLPTGMYTVVVSTASNRVGRPLVIQR